MQIADQYSKFFGKQVVEDKLGPVEVASTQADNHLMAALGQSQIARLRALLGVQSDGAFQLKAARSGELSESAGGEAKRANGKQQAENC